MGAMSLTEAQTADMLKQQRTRCGEPIVLIVAQAMLEPAADRTALRVDAGPGGAVQPHGPSRGRLRRALRTKLSAGR
eukprot:13698925-Heterocapsa_arctica.AAC.1